MTHETKSAERLALGWHYLGVFASLMFGLFSVIGLIAIEPMTNAPMPYGAIFKAEYFWGGTTAFVALAGAVWHVWAAVQHKQKLKGKRRK